MIFSEIELIRKTYHSDWSRLVNYEKIEMEKLLRPIVRWDCRAMAKNFTFDKDPVDYLMRESYRHCILDQRDQLTTLMHLIGHTRSG